MCSRPVTSCIAECSRGILFILSMLFLTISVFFLLITKRIHGVFIDAESTEINTGLAILVGLSIYLVVFAVVGICGSFYSSAFALWALVSMLIVNIIICTVVMTVALPNFDNGLVKLEASLEKFQAKYDWSHKLDSSDDIKKATRVWDKIQTNVDCCGLKTPDDWSKYRPAGLEQFLPISCCVELDLVSSNKNYTDKYCDATSKAATKNGCSKNTKAVYTMISIIIVALICCSVAPVIFAAIFLACRSISWQ